jgi:uncharacterized membrane protein
MSWKLYLLLSSLGLAMALFVAGFQAFPGYMDSDYYFAGGIQLAQGKGFNEPYIWNYLDDPAGLPHPSHSYWMPLASILAAIGMWSTGTTHFAAGRLAFIALAATVPAATARLAYSFSGRAFPAVVSGTLAVFSIYYAPFLPVPDNYGTYLVLGALFMLAAAWNRAMGNIAMGMTAGAMSLARSDGVLWLLIGAIACVAQASAPARSSDDAHFLPARCLLLFRRTLFRVGLLGAGFLLLAAPWMLRNFQTYGSIRAPGAAKLLWLTTYDEIFTYPASGLTQQTWWKQGVPSLVAARLSALRWNLTNALAAQAGVFLLPFILVGAWVYRRDLRVRLGGVGWLILLIVMTVALPAVGARGGWFHAGAGFQALWWCLAPLGLERVVAGARKRQLFTAQAQYVFGIALVCIAAIMTAYILWVRVLPGWGEGEDQYPAVDRRLVASGARPGDIVMVRNPPGYYIMTGRPAIAIPYADSATMLQVARRYGADFLAIEQVGAAGPIRKVYDDLHNENIEFLGEEDGTRLFRILP